MYQEFIKFGVWLNKEEYPSAKMPKKAHDSDAGYDICLALPLNNIVPIKTLIVPANGRVIAPTGVHFKLMEGWEAQVRPRSGNALKLGLTVLNTPGTIDPFFVGHVQVILYNTTNEDIVLEDGSKIAQIVFQKIPNVVLELLEQKPTNETRGESGFGSTGIKGN